MLVKGSGPTTRFFGPGANGLAAFDGDTGIPSSMERLDQDQEDTLQQEVEVDEMLQQQDLSQVE